MPDIKAGARPAEDFHNSLRFSAQSSPQPFFTPPPYHLVLTKQALTRVKLSWSDSSKNLQGFSLFKKSGDSPYVEIASLAPADTLYVDSLIMTDLRYEYVVKAKINGALTSPSDPVSYQSGLFKGKYLPDQFELDSNTGNALDADNDGDYDMALLGRTNYNSGSSHLLTNDGTGQFNLTSLLAEPSTHDREFLVRDIDNDGDEDICLSQGEDFSWTKLEIYRNDLGSWTKVFETPQELYIYQFSLEDFNHDGWLDIFVSHSIGNNTGLSRYSLLYQTSPNKFADSQIEFFPGQPTVFGKFSITDFDNDGFSDILFTGGENGAAKILRSLGGNGFQQVNTNLPSLVSGFTFDCNRDGKKDILVKLYPGFAFYVNQGNFQFVLSPPFAEDAAIDAPRKVQSADFDLNGLPDLLLEDGYGNLTLLKNLNAEGFESLAVTQSPDHGYGVITDLENDGDLDIIGLSTYYLPTPNPIFENQIRSDSSLVVNRAPGIPANFAAVTNGSTVELTWDASTDDRTPFPYVSYNLEIKSTDGRVIVNPEMAPNEVFHRRMGTGNAGNGTHFTLNNLPAGNYLARLQSADAAFKFSVFTDALAFTITPGPEDLAITRLLLNKVKLTWKNPLSGEEKTMVERRTIESDFAKVAELSAGETTYVDSSLSYNKRYVYRLSSMNNSIASASDTVSWSTELFKVTETSIPNVYGYLDIGDVTADGRMELLVTGQRIENGYGMDITSAIFENRNGAWTKQDVGSQTIWRQLSNLRFEDLNGDHQLDLFDYGPVDVGSFKTEVFYGDGNRNFVSAYNSFTSRTDDIQSWWDFDQDNDLDAIALETVTYPPVKSLQQNNGGGNYTVYSSPSLTPYDRNIVGDFDRDGDEDVFQYNGGYILYWNSDGKLVKSSVTLSAPEGAKTLVADCDNDGWLDIFFFADGMRVYRNNGLDANGELQFSLTVDGLPIGDRLDCGWADYDHDGDMDFFIAAPDFMIYTNHGDGSFEPYRIRNFHANINNTRWIDFDNDGDLDLYVSGYFGFITAIEDHPHGIVLMNQLIVDGLGLKNSAPSAPSGLSAHQNETGLHLKWTPPQDDHTPSAGLTYDVVIYKGDGTAITKGAVDPGSAKRLKLQLGRSVSTLTLNNLEVGNYSWKVQAVDPSYQGSSFSDAGSFFYLHPAPVMGDTVIYSCGRDISLSASGQNIEWYSDSLLTNKVASGNYHPVASQTVYVTQTILGVRGVFNKVNIAIYSKPDPPVISNGNPAYYCLGQSQYLNAVGQNIKWYSDPDKKVLLASTTKLFVNATTADYYVTQTHDCESAVGKVAVRPFIDSRIYQSQDTLFSMERKGSFYQWSFNNSAIPNSNSYWILGQQKGIYSVSIQKGYCSAISDPYVILAVEDADEQEFKVYPNPTRDDLVVSGKQAGEGTISIFDTVGNLIVAYQLSGLSSFEKTISIRGWSKGVYIIFFRYGDRMVSRKLVIV